MLELDHKESWLPKNWCFWTVVLEKSLESFGLQGDQTSQFQIKLEYSLEGLTLMLLRKVKSESHSFISDYLRPYTVHGILQPIILEWVAYTFSRRSSWPKNWTRVSCITGRFLTNWAIRKTLIFWCWSWSSNSLATWYEELTHWKISWCWKRLRQEEKVMTEGEMVG